MKTKKSDKKGLPEDVQKLWESHQELLAMAILQQQNEPRNTVRGLEDAIPEAVKVIKPKAPKAVAVDQVIAAAKGWELAAQLLAKAIQNPGDTKLAWQSVLQFCKVNGSPTPKI